MQYVVALRSVYPRFAGLGKALVLLVNHLYVVVFLSQIVEHYGGVIRTAVVHYHYLTVGIRLVKSALHAAADKWRCIIGRYYY